MNSVVRRFNLGEVELSMMKGNDEVWFKGTDVARILGYTDPEQENPKERKRRGNEESTAGNRPVISTGQSTSSCYLHKRTRVLLLSLLEKNRSGLGL